MVGNWLLGEALITVFIVVCSWGEPHRMCGVVGTRSYNEITQQLGVMNLYLMIQMLPSLYALNASNAL